MTLASLVSDLASHRNILALNAAVEAVRAGEYGKGLALVAREIRKLADESQEVAQKMNGIIPEIKRAIYSTVKATEEGAKTAVISIPVAFIPDVNNQQSTVNSQQSTVNSQRLNLLFR
ncbi:methyl-accepting chemotaxis protein [Tychonema sp. LEGE 06208]|uniref:methyl-accepting chemotaxis protein n=1 Tax=Tychonema sp. LEGE 06208 TaxID=1828663 RepID=UPI00351CA55D